MIDPTRILIHYARLNMEETKFETIRFEVTPARTRNPQSIVDSIGLRIKMYTSCTTILIDEDRENRGVSKYRNLRNGERRAPVSFMSSITSFLLTSRLLLPKLPFLLHEWPLSTVLVYFKFHTCGSSRHFPINLNRSL
ncbi:hypothetical protein Pelo_3030 [Pelomyxa schiedti]|nr:hypothetical protein Pelo_3030 [Pelomyxa schiedti]